jgi:ABC-type uncharacterized transport system permease subunit
MTRALLSVVCHAYGFAAGAYLAYLLRQWAILPAVGRFLVGSGLVIHATALGASLWEQWGLKQGLGMGLALVSFLLMLIGLPLELRYKKPVIGAFLTPLALALLTAALLVPGEVAPLSDELRRPLLSVHITIALLGLAAFAVAAAVAAMYLLLDRQMKGKKFGVLFSRLPSLHFLDDLNRRLVVWGFIALSFTLVTGAFFASGQGGLFWEWRAKEIATLGAWCVFAAMLNARFFAGWQGRRAALVTMAGFGILIVSFLSSYNFGMSAGGPQ